MTSSRQRASHRRSRRRTVHAFRSRHRNPARRHGLRWLSAARRMQRPGNGHAWSIMLYTSGATAQPKGVPRQARRRRRSRMSAKHVRQRRTHARCHAAVSHYGRALVAGDVPDRRHVRLPAALQITAALALIRGGKNQQSLSGTDALPRSHSSRAFCRGRCPFGAQARASPAHR